MVEQAWQTASEREPDPGAVPLEADLRKAGFIEDTDAGKGSHTSWVHPDDPANKVVFSGHDGADAPRYLEQQVRRAIARARKETEL